MVSPYKPARCISVVVGVAIGSVSVSGGIELLGDQSVGSHPEMQRLDLDQQLLIQASSKMIWQFRNHEARGNFVKISIKDPPVAPRSYDN